MDQYNNTIQWWHKLLWLHISCNINCSTVSCYFQNYKQNNHYTYNYNYNYNYNYHR